MKSLKLKISFRFLIFDKILIAITFVFKNGDIDAL